MTEDVRQWICALALDPAFALAATSAEQLARKLDKLQSEATEAMQETSWDSARGAFLAKHPQARAGVEAFDAARFVAAMLAGMRAGLVEETQAWQRLLHTALAIQTRFKSWQQYVDGYELGRAFIGAKKQPPPAVPTHRWKLDLLGAGKVARTRYKHSKCGHCGGIKEQPSRTAYVYCDFCGELCDYDYLFVRAATTTAARPSVEEQRRSASIQKRLDAAIARDDRKTYRKLQRAEYVRLVESAPELMPPRIGDPTYRDAWIEYMAEATTALAFDREMVQHEAIYQSFHVALVVVKQKPRLLPDRVPMLLDAFIARTAHLERLSERSGLFERHPDRPTVAIWRHIEYAVFVQHWLPLVDENSAKTLIDRLGLAANFDAIPSNKRSKLPCHRCGNILEIVARARRVTCEYCGHRLELVAP